ncbi:MAG TPA: hypothetical protein VIR57_11300 [Chloroflexota bacterium]|jgi:hypothetical protein
MKRLVVFLVACVTGWWAYLKLRSHPKTAAKVAELERQGRLVVDKTSAVATSAKDQAATRAAGVADRAAEALRPVQDKLTELRGEAGAEPVTEPGTEHLKA